MYCRDSIVVRLSERHIIQDQRAKYESFRMLHSGFFLESGTHRLVSFVSVDHVAGNVPVNRFADSSRPSKFVKTENDPGR